MGRAGRWLLARPGPIDNSGWGAECTDSTGKRSSNFHTWKVVLISHSTSGMYRWAWKEKLPIRKWIISLRSFDDSEQLIMTSPVKCKLCIFTDTLYLTTCRDATVAGSRMIWFAVSPKRCELSFGPNASTYFYFFSRCNAWLILPYICSFLFFR